MTAVLIIDDETTVLRTVGEMLDLEGYEVRIADDGADGIDMALSGLPDLVICDLMMPKLNGFDILKALRGDAATRAIPIIMITGIRDEYVLQKMLDAGASACLEKPFTHEALFEVIHSVL